MTATAPEERIQWIRHSQRVILMVAELHRRGYQRMRFVPYEAELGWRCQLAAADELTPDGLWMREFKPAHCYTSASANHYFEWPGVENFSAVQLASACVANFPDLCRRSLGRDWAYAGWLCELLSYLRDLSALPIVAAPDLQTPVVDLRFYPVKHAASDLLSENWISLEMPLPPPPSMLSE